MVKDFPDWSFTPCDGRSATQCVWVRDRKTNLEELEPPWDEGGVEGGVFVRQPGL